MIDIVLTYDGSVIAAATDANVDLRAQMRKYESVPQSGVSTWQRARVASRSVGISQNAFFTDDLTMLEAAVDTGAAVAGSVLAGSITLFNVMGIIKSYKIESSCGRVSRVSLDIDAAMA